MYQEPLLMMYCDRAGGTSVNTVATALPIQAAPAGGPRQRVQAQKARDGVHIAKTQWFREASWVMSPPC